MKLKCPYAAKCPKKDESCFLRNSFKECIVYRAFDAPDSNKWDCIHCGSTYDISIEKRPKDLICAMCKFLITQ